jgi:iron complex transport system substrate-binding protein
MTRQQHLIGAVLLCCLLLAGAAWSGATRLLQDQVGRTIAVPARPQRVIALIPSLTEIVYALGRGDLLVGATQFAREPPAAASLPRVGSYLHLDIERIVALQPDLCLAARDGNPEHLVRRIEQLGIPVFALDPRTLPEISDSVTLLGDLLDARQQAAAITGAMAAKMAAVAARVQATEDRPGVFFQIDASPQVSAGRGTFIDGLISAAGGRNLAGERSGYPRFSWEEILVLQPEVVIIASMAGGYSEKELKEQWAKWPDIPAVKSGRVHVVDASLFDRPVPRLADGLVALARLLHPEAGQ